MKELEKKIEEAAGNYADMYANKHDDDNSPWYNRVYAWCTGAKSSEAKEYWEQKAENIWFESGIHSNIAREYWQQGMYTEEEVKALLKLYDNYEEFSLKTKAFDLWFNKVKKK